VELVGKETQESERCEGRRPANPNRGGEKWADKKKITEEGFEKEGGGLGEGASKEGLEGRGGRDYGRGEVRREKERRSEGARRRKGRRCGRSKKGS